MKKQYRKILKKVIADFNQEIDSITKQNLNNLMAMDLHTIKQDNYNFGYLNGLLKSRFYIEWLLDEKDNKKKNRE
jgi:hypothetical protein